MSQLTPEEQEELEMLERMEREALASSEGQDAAGRVHSQLPATKKPRPFSLHRFTVGSVRDALQNLVDFSEDVTGATLEGIISTGEAITGDKDPQPEDIKVNLPGFRQLEGTEEAGTAERISRSIGSYLVPFGAYAKAFRVAKGSTFLQRAGRGIAAGVATDITAQNPFEANLANILRDDFGISNEMIESLASEEDDAALVNRFRAAASNIPIGVAAEGLIEVGIRTLKAYRAVRGEAADAAAAVKAAQADYAVRRDLVTRAATEGAEEAAERGARAGAEEAADKARFNPESDVRPQDPETFEDILTFLQGKANLADADPDLLSRLAENLLKGDPENALAKMGIDPAKLDYSAFDDPDLLGRLHKGLAEVYEGIATRLGRSNVVVTEEALHSAARSLATEAQVLADLFAKTDRLGETLMGARLFVGSHAHKLVDSAEKALQALKSGQNVDALWTEFLENFHRHAFFMGALRGAGTEVGRALRSLRILAKTDAKKAKGVAKDIARDSQPSDTAGAQADEALSSLLAIESDAERMAVLNTVIDKGADMGELSQFVRTEVGSPLKRINEAVKETLGNLFSQTTAGFNIASGVKFLGLRALSRWIGVGMAALRAPFKGDLREARVALAEAWAYSDGLVTAWGQAWRNMLAVLEREGASELFVNADNLGLEKLSVKAQNWRADGRIREGINFERVDLDARPRSFAMTAADRRVLRDVIERNGFSTLMQKTMDYLARTAGVVLNAAGTLSRTGTILFINAPDQLIGTVAARAGAQVAAVRQAAVEAAEMGLEGKELSTYLKNRVVALGHNVDGKYGDEGFEGGFQEVAVAAGEHEAREILFQDQLEFGATRMMGKFHRDVPFAHVVVAFLHTPLRILERSLIDLTPLGLLKDRVRKAIIAGGPEGDQALAMMGLGTAAMAWAFQLAVDRDIVGADGGYNSTARLHREKYTLRIGDDHYEFVRDDPLGILLGLGADIRAYVEANEYDPEATEGVQEMIEAGVWSFFANIMSKSWLQSLEHLAALAGIDSDEGFSSRMSNYVNSFANRITPAAGVQKGIQRTLDPFERTALEFHEALLKSTVGAGKLPLKRDPLFGDPVKHNMGEIAVGLTWEPQSGDPVIRELGRLSYRGPNPSKKIEGVKMTAEQFSRFLELKGQVVRNKTGLTLKEAFAEAMQNPEYHQLSDEGKVAALRDLQKGYTRLAKQQLLEEFPDLAEKVARSMVFEEGRRDFGLSRPELEDEAEAFVRELRQQRFLD